MRSKAVVFLALVAGMMVAASGVAAGGEDPPPLVVNPESGLPGSSFTVSGEQCFIINGTDEVQGAGLQEEGPEVEVTVAFPTPLTQSTNANAETGAWSVTFTVPEATPAGTYTVSATCFNTFNGEVTAADFDYPTGALFTVLAETPAAPVVPPTPGAAPAAAVAGAPRFTG